MKVAIITDTHFGVRNESPIWLEAHAKMLKEFFAQIKANKIKTIWMLGDIVDSRKSVSSKLLAWIKQNWTQPIIDMKLEVHLILGNHDTFYKSTNRPNIPIEIFGHVKNFHIYEHEPVELSVDGKSVLMCPWICPENESITQQALSKTYDVVCGHFGIEGCLFQGNQVSDHGMDPQSFKQHGVVFSGHFHKKSITGNINYLGNPIACNWGESGDPHGWHFYDIANNKLDFIEFHYPLYKKVHISGQDQSMYVYEDDGSCFVKVFVAKDRNEFYLQQLISQVRALDHVLQLQIIDDRQETDVSDIEFDETELRDDLLGLMKRTVHESDYEEPEAMIALLTELYFQTKQSNILGN